MLFLQCTIHEPLFDARCLTKFSLKLSIDPVVEARNGWENVRLELATVLDQAKRVTRVEPNA